MQVFWQLRWFFRQEWRRYSGAIFILCLVSAFELLPPRAIGWIVDGVVSGDMSSSTMFMWLGGLSFSGPLYTCCALYGECGCLVPLQS